MFSRAQYVIALSNYLKILQEQDWIGFCSHSPPRIFTDISLSSKYHGISSKTTLENSNKPRSRIDMHAVQTHQRKNTLNIDGFKPARLYSTKHRRKRTYSSRFPPVQPSYTFRYLAMRVFIVSLTFPASSAFSVWPVHKNLGNALTCFYIEDYWRTTPSSTCPIDLLDVGYNS